MFKRYQRSEQAFVLGLMEMYLQGVSTRKVTHITEELCGVSFSKSTVSQLCTGLDARLNAWRSRPLSSHRYPFLIVDAHEGLVQALKKNFQGASWQRCQVHFIRNVLGHASRQLRGEMAADLKLIFQANDKATATRLSSEFLNKYEGKAAKSADYFERGTEDALSVLQFPAHYRRRLKTTNLAERMNEEIRRRQRVIRIFPNEAATYRLIGALLADQYEAWMNGMRYFDMSDYWDWRKENPEACVPKEKIVAIS